MSFIHGGREVSVRLQGGLLMSSVAPQFMCARRKIMLQQIVLRT